jgi:hypothetical protein
MYLEDATTREIVLQLAAMSHDMGSIRATIDINAIISPIEELLWTTRAILLVICITGIFGAEREAEPDEEETHWVPSIRRPCGVTITSSVRGTARRCRNAPGQ